jgi:hypothetical protein
MWWGWVRLHVCCHVQHKVTHAPTPVHQVTVRLQQQQQLISARHLFKQLPVLPIVLEHLATTSDAQSTDAQQPGSGTGQAH